MSRKSNWIHCAWLILVLSAAGAFAQEAAVPTLSEYDAEVAAYRHLMRECCAVVQDMMNDREVDAAKQERGLALLSELRDRWAALRSRFESNPPAEYAGYKAFKVRLRDITDATEAMETALAAGFPRRSMLACGSGCGLFVAMHEENGMEYALDKLFHLRKAGKTARSVFKSKGLEAVRPLLPELLKLRDEAVLASPPSPRGDFRNDDYMAGIRDLSVAMDEMALAAATGDAEKVGAILGKLTSLVNKPYGLAL